MSDKSTSQEASRSVWRAIKLLVKSSPIIRCSLADSARRVRARVQSNSRTLPISCIVWRWRAWTCASISRVAFKTRSLLGVVLIGSATPLPPASGWGDHPGVGASVGDTFAPSDLPFRPWTAHLASCHRLDSSNDKGRMRSKAMFQWSVEGGLRLSALFWPCLRLWGNFSDSYSSRDELLSPRKQGKVIWWANSPPGCWLQTVWSLKPLKERGDIGSPMSPMVSLDATSNKTGCCTTAGITSLISEMFTNRRHDAVHLSSDSSSEPAECHTFNCT